MYSCTETIHGKRYFYKSIKGTKHRITDKLAKKHKIDSCPKSKNAQFADLLANLSTQNLTIEDLKVQLINLKKSHEQIVDSLINKYNQSKKTSTDFQSQINELTKSKNDISILLERCTGEKILLSSENSTLKNNLHDLQTQLENQQLDLNKLKSDFSNEINNLKIKLQKCNDDLANEIKLNGENITELNKSHEKELFDLSQSLNKKIDDLLKEKETLLSQIQNLSSEKQLLHDQKELLKNQLDILIDEKAELTSQLSKTLDELTTSKNTINQRDIRIKDLENEADDLKNKIEILKGEASGLEFKIELIESQEELLKRENAENKSIIQDIKNKLTQENLNKVMLEQQLLQTNNEIANIKTQLDTANNKNVELEQQLKLKDEQHAEKISILQQSIIQKTSELDMERNKLIEIQRELKSLQDKYDNSEEVNTNLKKEIDTLLKEKSEQMKLVINHVNEITLLKSELENSQNNLETKTHDLELISKMHDEQLKEIAKSAGNTHVALLNEKNSLEDQLKKSTETIVQLKSKLKQLRTDTTKQIGDLKSELLQSGIDIVNLKSVIDSKDVEIQSHKTKLEDITILLNNSNSKVLKLKHTQLTLETKINDLTLKHEQQLLEKNTEIDKLNIVIQTLKNEEIELKRQHNLLIEQTVNKYENMIKERDITITSLENNLSDLKFNFDTERKTNDSHVTNLNNKINKLLDKIRNYKQQVKQDKSKIQQVEENITLLKNNILDLSSKLLIKTNDVKKLQDTIADFEQKTKERDNTIQRLIQEIKDTEWKSLDVINSKQGSIDRQKELIKRLKSKALVNIKNREKIISQHLERISNLENKDWENMQTINDKENKIQDLEQNLTSNELNINNLLRETETLKDQIWNNFSSLNESTNTIEDKSNLIAKLRVKVEELTSTIIKLAKSGVINSIRMNTLLKTINDYSISQERLDSVVTELNMKILSLNEQSLLKDSENNSLKLKLSDMSQEITTLLDKTNIQAADISELRSEITVLKSELEKSKLHETTVSELKNILQQFEKDLNEKNDEIRILNEQIELLKQEDNKTITILQQKVLNLEDQISLQTNKTKQDNNEISKLRKQLDKTNKELSSKSTLIDNLRLEMQRDARQLVNSIKTSRDMGKTMYDLQSKLRKSSSDYKGQVDILKEEVERLQQELKLKVEEELQPLTKKLETLERISAETSKKDMKEIEEVKLRLEDEVKSHSITKTECKTLLEKLEKEVANGNLSRDELRKLLDIEEGKNVELRELNQQLTLKLNEAEMKRQDEIKKIQELSEEIKLLTIEGKEAMSSYMNEVKLLKSQFDQTIESIKKSGQEQKAKELEAIQQQYIGEIESLKLDRENVKQRVEQATIKIMELKDKAVSVNGIINNLNETIMALRQDVTDRDITISKMMRTIKDHESNIKLLANDLSKAQNESATCVKKLTDSFKDKCLASEAHAQQCIEEIYASYNTLKPKAWNKNSELCFTSIEEGKKCISQVLELYPQAVALKVENGSIVSLLLKDENETNVIERAFSEKIPINIDIKGTQIVPFVPSVSQRQEIIQGPLLTDEINNLKISLSNKDTLENGLSIIGKTRENAVQALQYIKDNYPELIKEENDGFFNKKCLYDTESAYKCMEEIDLAQQKAVHNFMIDHEIKKPHKSITEKITSRIEKVVETKPEKMKRLAQELLDMRIGFHPMTEKETKKCNELRSTLSEAAKKDFDVKVKTNGLDQVCKQLSQFIVYDNLNNIIDSILSDKFITGPKGKQTLNDEEYNEIYKLCDSMFSNYATKGELENYINFKIANLATDASNQYYNKTKRNDPGFKEKAPREGSDTTKLLCKNTALGYKAYKSKF